ncbi:uncharacterized protein LOC125494766 [Beta vulgaris subsp. vulgaris]|uniref:uncharacterized protein LOC125494766 n=1 Tax=Beta vulgaris subsp. vulgaris TaxID=3555 RepID=UPI00254729C9|nr:uncharacterized protein LOC125494766 [Beta vulgaris subsp. vulgaris]
MSIRLRSDHLLPIDHNLEGTLRALRRIFREPRVLATSEEQPGEVFEEDQSSSSTSSIMAEGPPPPRALRDYGHPEAFELKSGIRRPATTANFEFSPHLIRMIKQEPYGGFSHECPLDHLANFLELCATVKQNNVNQEFVRLNLFHFSLTGKAKKWLQSLPPDSLTTWAQVTAAFVDEFYSQEKTSEARRKISNFIQDEDESLNEAWDRFKDLRRSCPHHGYSQWMLMQSFYDGLLPMTRASLDSGAGGQLTKLPVDNIEPTIEEVVRHYSWGNTRSTSKKASGKGKYDVDAMDHIHAKLDTLAKKLEKVNLASPSQPPSQAFSCEICGGTDHASSYCGGSTEHVAWVGARQEGPTNFNNQGRWNNPSQGSWKHPPPQNHNNYTSNFRPPGFNQPQQRPPFEPNQPKPSSLESTLQLFLAQQTKTNTDNDKKFGDIHSSLQQMQAHNKMIETQLAQIAQQVSNTTSPLLNFQANP